MILLNEDLHRLVSSTEEELGKAVEKAEEILEEDEGKLTQHDLLKLRYGYNRAAGSAWRFRKGEELYTALSGVSCISRRGRTSRKT